MAPRPRQSAEPSPASGTGPDGGTLLWMVSGLLLPAMAAQTILGNPAIAGAAISRGLWRRVVEMFGGDFEVDAAGQIIGAAVPFVSLLLTVTLTGAMVWLAGTWWITRRTEGDFAHSLWPWGRACGRWGVLLGSWEIVHLIASLIAPDAVVLLIRGTPQFWLSGCAAGLAGNLFLQSARPEPLFHISTATTDAAPAPRADTRSGLRSLPLSLLAAVGVSIIVFTALNWRLYDALLIPHGDSAMYEEHLWNFTHGNGFRSWLDNGRLFLGEHVQVIHLLLIPLHLVWPSMKMLDLCESAALASGALPVFWLTLRHTESRQAAILLGVAWLLYAPLHYLDISIDIKTFRPIAFGVPLLLFALDQMERGRWKTMTVLMLLTLAAKEDFAAILAPLGVWIACRPSAATAAIDAPARLQKNRRLGIALAIFSVIYLLLVIKVVIPAFRGGDVHYARYFGELGSSPGDIVRSFLTQPALVLGKLFSPRSKLYLLALLMPLGMLPLLSPGRLSVAAPLFAVLCLLELSADPAAGGEALVPWHHFHAPVLPIIFWAAAAGLTNVPVVWNLIRDRWRKLRGRTASTPSYESVSTETVDPRIRTVAVFACGCAVVTGMFLSFSPLSLGFWDPGTSLRPRAIGAWWGDRYVPGERAEMLPPVIAEIPRTARVFSTDFVHPRFTHWNRSYDYSAYARHSDAELTDPVPGEQYYIVIDTRHPYSTIQSPDQIPQLRDHPDDWELLPIETRGYYLVLRRK